MPETVCGDSKNEDEMDLATGESKSHRPRKKHLYEQIQKQIEFYFSDVNLSKDRFFKEKIQEDPEIPLELILRCNKIKALTTDPRDLVHAISKSEILAVTEDETKIYRKTEVKIRQNEDDCSIYVENLPPDAQHDWLTKIFLSYGNVLYVSIPRFRNSNRRKGFAFVEFDSPASVTKVLEAFGTAGCRLPGDMPSENLRSVQTFEDDKEKVIFKEYKVQDHVKHEKYDDDDEEDDDVEEKKEPMDGAATEKDTDNTADKTADPSSSLVKRKRKVSTEDSPPEEPKKLKQEDEDKERDVRKEEGNSSKDQGMMNGLGGEIDEDQEDSMDDEGGDDDKKRRARHRKKKGKKKQQMEVASLGLQVMSKKEWKRLRNKYLTLQREKMAALKKQLWQARIQEQQEKLDEILQEKEMKEQAAREMNGKSAPNYTFTEGVILLIEPEDYIEDLKQFKNEAKAIKGVAYVDLTPERKNVFIRCESSEDAKNLLEAKCWPNTSLLKGEAEKAYWKKIHDDREAKLNKGRQKERGRDKLLRKAQKMRARHTRLGDDNEGEGEGKEEEMEGVVGKEEDVEGKEMVASDVISEETKSEGMQ